MDGAQKFWTMTRTAVGVLVWAGIIACLACWSPARTIVEEGLRTGRQVWSFAVGTRAQFSIPYDPAVTSFGLGDPVFMVGPSPTLAGRVVAIHSEGPAVARIELFSNGVPCDPYAMDWTLHEADLTAAGLLQTLLPEVKQQAMAERFAEAWHERREQTWQTVAPAIREVVDTIYPVVEAEIEKSLQRHGETVRGIFRRHQTDYWSPEFSQLARDVAWPALRVKTQPVVDDLSSEIWQRVSVWRLGWRYLADKVGVGGGALDEEWKRFMAEDALPIIEGHMSDIVSVASDVLADTASDPRVQETLRVALERLVQDPQMQDLMGTIAREAIFENEQVGTAVADAWKLPTVQRALDDLTRQWEPVVVGLMNDLLSDGEGGLSPELMQVLRAHLLQKDRRWIAMKPRAGELRPPTLVRAMTSTAYPVPKRQEPLP